MPTYDYRCNACKHEFELFQSMKDSPKRKCPQCGKNALERLIGTGAAVLFRGSGFYETDYRSAEYKKAAKADAPADKSDKAGEKGAASTPSETKTGSTGETKPATKPATNLDQKPAATTGKSVGKKPAES